MGAQDGVDMTTRTLKPKTILPFVLLAASWLQAATFTGPHRWYDMAYVASETVTITVTDHSEEAVISLPSRLVPGYPWSPPAAVMFNGADSYDGVCYSTLYGSDGEYGNCTDDLALIDKGNGTHEIRLPVGALMAAIKPHHFRQRRYDTCVRTGGADDILTGGRCPPIGDSGLDGPQAEMVEIPHTALILRFDLSRGDGRQPEFHFLADTSLLRANNAFDLTDGGQPLEEHYGEMDRMIAWYALNQTNGTVTGESDNHDTITYDATDTGAILDAMSELVDILEPRIRPGAVLGNHHVDTIRWHVKYLRNNPQWWKE